MEISERVDLYKKLFKDAKAIKPVKRYFSKGSYPDQWAVLEALRELNTELADLYQIEIPVITCWVRDSNYVPETREIYLAEAEIEGFLHQWRHHLQNIERRYERRGLCIEGIKGTPYDMPYTDCVYALRGEDDAIAWSKAIIKLAQGKKS